jgi:hypothetical protein
MSVKRVLTIGGCVLCVVLWGLAAAWYSDGASARCLSQREASAMYGGADFPTCNVDLHWIPCSDRWGYCYGAQSSAECTSRPFCVYCSASDETNFNVGPPWIAYMEDHDLHDDGCGWGGTGSCAWVSGYCDCVLGFLTEQPCSRLTITYNTDCIPPDAS